MPHPNIYSPQALASGARDKFMAQSRSTRVVETSAALTLLAVAVFWTALIGSPRSTEADQRDIQVNPTQLTLDAPRDLPSFEDKFQRHTGVLDTLAR
jgi:hypothetical protein